MARETWSTIKSSDQLSLIPNTGHNVQIPHLAWCTYSMTCIYICSHWSCTNNRQWGTPKLCKCFFVHAFTSAWWTSWHKWLLPVTVAIWHVVKCRFRSLFPLLQVSSLLPLLPWWHCGLSPWLFLELLQLCCAQRSTNWNRKVISPLCSECCNIQVLLCSAISVVIYYPFFLLQSSIKRTSLLLFLLWRYLMVTPPPLLTPPPTTFTSSLMTLAPSSSNPTQVTTCWKWVVSSSNERPAGEWSWRWQILVMLLTDHCWMYSTFIPKSLTWSLSSVDPLCVYTVLHLCEWCINVIPADIGVSSDECLHSHDGRQTAAI